MRLILAAATLALIAGCADSALVGATAPTVVANSNNELDGQTKLKCHKQSDLGSQMIHTVCEAEQTDAQRQQTQQRMQDLAPSQGVAHPGIGGN